jgi:hypothetical protein
MIPLFLLQLLQQLIPPRFFNFLLKHITQCQLVITGITGVVTFQVKIAAVSKIFILLLTKRINNIERYRKPFGKEFLLNTDVHT